MSSTNIFYKCKLKENTGFRYKLQRIYRGLNNVHCEQKMLKTIRTAYYFASYNVLPQLNKYFSEQFNIYNKYY